MCQEGGSRGLDDMTQGTEVIWWTGQGTGVSGVTNELVTFQQTSGLAA